MGPVLVWYVYGRLVDYPRGVDLSRAASESQCVLSMASVALWCYPPTPLWVKLGIYDSVMLASSHCADRLLRASCMTSGRGQVCFWRVRTMIGVVKHARKSHCVDGVIGCGHRCSKPIVDLRQALPVSARYWSFSECLVAPISARTLD